MPPKSRVLIVEDDPAFRAALARLLVRMGHEVRAVATAAEALVTTSEWSPHHLLLDVVLPDESGLSVLRAVRRQQLPTRVAIMTALQLTPESPEVAEWKPEAVVNKPLDVFTLGAWLAS